MDRTGELPIIEVLRRRVAATIDRLPLFPRGARVVVAVSGGLDSSVLLDLLAALAGPRDLSLTALHVDHGVRPQSGAEGEVVAAQARSLGLPCRRERAQIERRRDGGASEAAMRQGRFEVFARISRELGAYCVATAHTADDQAETLLLRLGRGTGPDGLAGVLRESRVGRVRVTRPLLTERRSTLEEYALARGIRWVHDPSNDSDAFLRNRVRHELLPQLGALFGDGVVTRLGSLAALMADEREAMDALVDDWEGTVWRVVEPPRSGVQGARGEGRAGVVFSLDALAPLPSALRRRCLRGALRRVGVSDGIYRRHLDALERLTADRDGSAQLDLPGGLVARRVYDTLTVGPPPTGAVSNTNTKIGTTKITAPGRHILDDPAGRFLFDVQLLDSAPTALQASPDEAWVDATSSAPFPLTIRPTQPGDRLRLPGLSRHGDGSGGRKISRVLIDRKIPRDLRGTVRLLLDAQERVLLALLPRLPSSVGASADALERPALIVRAAARRVERGRGPVLHIRLGPPPTRG